MTCGTSFINQCCAVVNIDGKERRCINVANTTIYHCSVHHDFTSKLYKDYKKICSVAYKMNISKRMSNMSDRLKYLMKCYVWLNKAYDARYKHRKVAFVPECYDEGHDYQFTMLKQKIDICENEIKNIYDSYDKKNNVPKKETIITTENDLMDVCENGSYDLMTIPNKVEKFKNIRKNKDLDIDEQIEQYIKVNAEELKKKDSIKQITMKYIKLMYKEKNYGHLSGLMMIVPLHKICDELYQMKYFDDDYAPLRCKCGKCDNYVCFDIVLGCECIKYSNIDLYFNGATYTAISKFYTLILRNKDKIMPILDDYIHYHKIYGPDVITMKLTLEWSIDKKRMVIGENDYWMDDLKKSKLKSLKRVKLGCLGRKYFDMFKKDIDDNESDSDSGDE